MHTHANAQSLTSTPYRGLVNPWADVLLLGAGSLLALLLLNLFDLGAEGVAQLAVLMMVLANFVNHPHFAFSYQLFYGSWHQVKSGALPSDLRQRWWLAGVWVPLLLALVLFATALLWLQGKPLALGVVLSLMGLLVGWHYVKQGFGMAMMDAALKKRYWPAAVRKALLFNAYACWAGAWTVVNSVGSPQRLWAAVGIPVSVPGPVVVLACLVAAASSTWAGLLVFRAIRQWNAEGLSWKEWPLAGLLAYGITLYVWIGLISFSTAFLLVVPFFHSLQYLTVIGRYKVNETKSKRLTPRHLLQFVATGVILGAIGFWLLPGAVDFARTGELPHFGAPALAIACFWIFINVHHYFIDNVLWRQGNPNVKKHLFDA